MFREGKADRRRGLHSEFNVTNKRLRDPFGGRVHWGLGVKRSRARGIVGAIASGLS